MNICCSTCGVTLDSHNASPSTLERGSGYCRACALERTKRWQRENPERYKAHVRAAHLKAKYGLTPEQFNEMARDQANQCPVCRVIQKREDLCVDHCHVTGKVRALLCNSCNIGLGLLKTAHTCERAANYLKEHAPE